ncbi:MAG: hypothetical protein LQ345_004806 [Seirophora villosa]|nr:MAG: hypothetical protein LQ345_004806 [Seirophora villosa]
MFEDGARKRLEDDTATGEQKPEPALETANTDSLEGNAQQAATASPTTDALALYDGLGDLFESEDFAAFTATGQNFASTQRRVSFSELLTEGVENPIDSTQYPPLDNLTVPDRPYSLDSSAHQAFWGVLGGDNQGIQTPAIDGDFPFDDLNDPSIWDAILSGPPLNHFDIDQTCQQVREFSNDIWNARPGLDEVHDVPGFGSQPPPLPLHSKPNLEVHRRLQQKHFHSPAPAPSATKVPQVSSMPPSDGEWTPDMSAVDEEEDLVLALLQNIRKRKAPATASKDSGRRKKQAPAVPRDDSDNEADLPWPIEKNQKITAAATKMAYVQSLVKPAPPGKTLNARTQAIQLAGEISKTYDQLPMPSTQNWSTFKYSAAGELNPDELLTASEIQNYLYNHPLHTLASGIYDPKNGGLRIWIQRNPSDSSRRYASPRLNRCKFRDCFATNNVINQGHIRVCFDEQTHLGLNNNPFHVAAFVHLNCLERFLDFPAVCRDLPISPENRELPNEPKGRNRMMLSPDILTHVAFSFIRECEYGTLRDYPEHGRPHRGTLTWQLMSNKVDDEAPVLQRQRANRGEKASHITVHLGDLELEARARDMTRRAKYQVNRKMEETLGSKRKHLRDSEGESGSDEEVLKPRRKYTKRRKA